MKKLFIIPLLILLIPVVVNADYEEVHNSWHEYQDQFTVDGKIYEIKLNVYDFDQLILKTEDFNYILRKGRCTDEGVMRYCFMNYSFESDYETIAYNDELVPGVHIVIKKDTINEASMSVDVSVPDDAHLLKEQEIEVKFTNNDDDWINFVNYQIIIPENITLIDQGSFTLVGDNTLKADFTLKPNQYKTYTFKILPDTYDSHKFTTRLEYDAISEVKTMDSSFSYTISKPFIFDVLMESEIEQGSYTTLVINLENLNPEQVLEVNRIKIAGSENLVYTPVKNVNRRTSNEYLSSINEIAENSKDEIRLRIDAPYVGDHLIQISYELESQGNKYIEEINRTLKVSIPTILVTFFVDKDRVESGDNMKIHYYVENQDDNQVFKNIVSEIYGPGFKETINMPLLNIGEQKKPLIREITAPILDSEQTVIYVANTSYESDVGQRFFVSKSDAVVVIGSNQNFDVQWSINDTNPEAGSIVLVTTNVKNEVDKTIENVQVSEILPGQVIVQSGDTENKISLYGQETKQAYIYKFKIPVDYSYQTLNITTNVKTDMYDNDFVKEINVRPVIHEEETKEVDITTDNDANLGQTNSEPVEKKGFFAKVLDSIAEFFSGLFS